MPRTPSGTTPRNFLIHGSCGGRDAVIAHLTDQVDAIGQMKNTIVDVRERGETVVVRIELTVHGLESGIDVPGEMAQVIEVVDGRIQRSRMFFTWDEALEAAGLEE